MAYCSKLIGFVWQDFKLISEMTAHDNIILPTKIHRKELDRAYLSDLLDILEISDKIHKFPKQLSGGEQQRSAIARALVLRPRLVLADD